MKKNATMITTINFQGWTATLENNILTIELEGDSREYDIKEKNNGFNYQEGENTFQIKFDSGYYHFSFGDSGEFVGDVYDNDDEHVREFACFWFGED
jgi:hypothetical protein